MWSGPPGRAAGPGEEECANCGLPECGPPGRVCGVVSVLAQVPRCWPLHVPGRERLVYVRHMLHERRGLIHGISVRNLDQECLERLELFQTPTRGMGVRAVSPEGPGTVALRADTELCSYTGVLQNEELVESSNWCVTATVIPGKHDTENELRRNRVLINGKRFGNLSRFFNASESHPNVRALVSPETYKASGFDFAVPVMMTNRDIMHGEELLISYGSEYWQHCSQSYNSSPAQSDHENFEQGNDDDANDVSTTHHLDGDYDSNGPDDGEEEASENEHSFAGGIVKKEDDEDDEDDNLDAFSYSGEYHTQAVYVGQAHNALLDDDNDKLSPDVRSPKRHKF